MKKRWLSMLLATSMVATMVAGCGGSNGGSETKKPDETKKPAEKQDVSLTMWGAEEDQEMLKGMIESFKETYKDVANFDIKLGVESESTAKDTILIDPTAAADVFAFASDQLPTLVKAKALQGLNEVEPALQAYAKKGLSDIQSANGAGSVEASTYEGTMYAFPMTADNGYFLYYDSTVLSAEDVASWDTMLAKAEAAGKKVGMTLNSGWYNASFFYSAGLTTGLNADGSTAIDWNKSADYSGVEVVQSMLKIAGHKGFMAVADGDISNQIASGQLCAAVSGTWDASAAQAAFGDGFAATKLPTINIAGNEVQQASVAGFKLVGVSPYSKNVGWAALLAEYITNEQNQAIRFEKRQIGPSNLNVAASDAVVSNTALGALAAQNAYGVLQLVGDNYWNPTATLGEMIATGQLKADDVAGIQAALDTMVDGVTAPIQ